MPAQGPITPLDSRWPRMADSWSTLRPRPGWPRCGCTTCRAARRASCPARAARRCRSGRRTWRRSDSSRAERSACWIWRAAPHRTSLDAPSGRGAAWNRDGDLVFAPSPNSALMRRDASGSIAALTTLEAGETVACVAVVSRRRPSRDLSRHAQRSRRDRGSGSPRSTIHRHGNDCSRPMRRRSLQLKPRPQDLRTSRPHRPLPQRSRIDGAAARCRHARAMRPRGGRRVAGRPRPARADLRDRIGRCADLRRAGHDAARAAMADARRHAGGIAERADRCVGSAHRAGRQTDRRDGDRSRNSARSMSSSAPDRNRRRRGCRCRPTSTRAACGRRMACASRGPDSGAR